MQNTFDNQSLDSTTIASKDADDRADWQVLELMFSQQATAITAALINVVVLTCVYWGDVSPWVMGLWLVAYLCVAGLRTGISSRYAKLTDRDQHSISPWMKWVDVVQLLTGVLWGGLLGYLTLTATTTQLVVVCMVMVGLVSGGLLTFSYRLKAYFLFSVSTTLPVFVMLMARPQTMWAPAFLTVFGFVSLSILSRRFAKFHRHAIRLSISNQDLASRLEAKNREVTELNRTLEGKVEILGDANSELQAEQERIVDIATQLESLSSTDPLTGIPNRRQFEKMLKRNWTLSRRAKKELALILVDVDHFKAYNDHYGHQQGDRCLIQVAHIIREICNTGASVSRYGGEEFAVLVPNADFKEAHRLGRQIVDAVLSAQLPHAKSPTAQWVTVSAGLTALRPTQTLDSGILIDQADRALYAAKDCGRNRLVSDRADGDNHGSVYSGT
ncbi:MAG: GGDEF domain-containing protein [Lysobacterales bacterium]